MKLTISLCKPTNKANASVPLDRTAAVRANYARIAAKRKERDDAWLATRAELSHVSSDKEGRPLFMPLGYRIVYPYKGVKPDADNCVARCKALLDGCALAFGMNDRDLELLGIERVDHRDALRRGLDVRRVYIEFDDMTERREQ